MRIESGEWRAQGGNFLKEVSPLTPFKNFQIRIYLERVYPYLKAFEGCILLDVFGIHNMVGAGALDSPFFHKIQGGRDAEQARRPPPTEEKHINGVIGHVY